MRSNIIVHAAFIDTSTIQMRDALATKIKEAPLNECPKIISTGLSEIKNHVPPNDTKILSFAAEYLYGEYANKIFRESKDPNSTHLRRDILLAHILLSKNIEKKLAHQFSDRVAFAARLTRHVIIYNLLHIPSISQEEAIENLNYLYEAANEMVKNPNFYSQEQRTTRLNYIEEFIKIAKDNYNAVASKVTGPWISQLITWQKTEKSELEKKEMTQETLIPIYAFKLKDHKEIKENGEEELKLKKSIEKKEEKTNMTLNSSSISSPEKIETLCNAINTFFVSGRKKIKNSIALYKLAQNRLIDAHFVKCLDSEKSKEKIEYIKKRLGNQCLDSEKNKFILEQCDIYLKKISASEMEEKNSLHKKQKKNKKPPSSNPLQSDNNQKSIEPKKDGAEEDNKTGLKQEVKNQEQAKPSNQQQRDTKNLSKKTKNKKNKAANSSSQEHENKNLTEQEKHDTEEKTGSQQSAEDLSKKNKKQESKLEAKNSTKKEKNTSGQKNNSEILPKNLQQPTLPPTKSESEEHKINPKQDVKNTDKQKQDKKSTDQQQIQTKISQDKQENKKQDEISLNKNLKSAETSKPNQTILNNHAELENKHIQKSNHSQQQKPNETSAQTKNTRKENLNEKQKEIETKKLSSKESNVRPEKNVGNYPQKKDKNKRLSTEVKKPENKNNFSKKEYVKKNNVNPSPSSNSISSSENHNSKQLIEPAQPSQQPKPIEPAQPQQQLSQQPKPTEPAQLQQQPNPTMPTPSSLPQQQQQPPMSSYGSRQPLTSTHREQKLYPFTNYPPHQQPRSMGHTQPLSLLQQQYGSQQPLPSTRREQQLYLFTNYPPHGTLPQSPHVNQHVAPSSHHHPQGSMSYRQHLPLARHPHQGHHMHPSQQQPSPYSTPMLPSRGMPFNPHFFSNQRTFTRNIKISSPDDFNNLIQQGDLLTITNEIKKIIDYKRIPDMQGIEFISWPANIANISKIDLKSILDILQDLPEVSLGTCWSTYRAMGIHNIIELLFKLVFGESIETYLSRHFSNGKKLDWEEELAWLVNTGAFPGLNDLLQDESMRRILLTMLQEESWENLEQPTTCISVLLKKIFSALIYFNQEPEKEEKLDTVIEKFLSQHFVEDLCPSQMFIDNSFKNQIKNYIEKIKKIMPADLHQRILDELTGIELSFNSRLVDPQSLLERCTEIQTKYENFLARKESEDLKTKLSYAINLIKMQQVTSKELANQLISSQPVYYYNQPSHYNTQQAFLSPPLQQQFLQQPQEVVPYTSTLSNTNK